jgi:hypothetical protein
MSSALKLGRKEGIDYHLRNTESRYERTKAKNVRVIVQTGVLCAVNVTAKRRANTLMLVCRNADADTRATYEVLQAQLDRYPELQNDINYLSEFSSHTNNVDFAGRIVYNEKGVEVFNFGKHKGIPVREVFQRDPSYYSWMMQGDFTLNTKQVLTRIKLESR